MSQVTIADVARVAGVSKSTVSRVLNQNSEYMREETRKKVEAAIAKLNYRPSHVARSLALKRTQALALVVSDIGNPFYAEVMQGVEKVAYEHDYNIFLCNINYDLDRGQKLIQSLIDRSVDGVLLMSSSFDIDWIQQLSDANIPAVILDWEVRARGYALVSSITVDFRPGIEAAAQHLLDLGHRVFAHISGPMHLKTSQARHEAFAEALHDSDIPVQLTLFEGDLRIDGGRASLHQVLQQTPTPTAIFTGNDMMGLGILTEALANNIRIPDDISVVGLDDIWLTSQLRPTLTTVSLPRYEIGQLAVEQLLYMLDKNEPKHHTVQTDFIIRESTGSITLSG